MPSRLVCILILLATVATADSCNPTVESAVLFESVDNVCRLPKGYSMQWSRNWEGPDSLYVWSTSGPLESGTIAFWSLDSDGNEIPTLVP